MEHIRKHRATYIVILLSTLSFLMLYGFNVLDVTYTDWLLCGGDLSQHYLGWKFFRCAPWQWYIGMMNNIAYPFSESIIFTDSIPLLAVIFKLCHAILPKSYQYFGLWGLLCFVLQGWLSSLILRKYLPRGGIGGDLQVILGSMFFVFAPILIRRMYWHTSLGGQWLILLALLFYVYHDEWFTALGKTVLIWGGMGILCASVHIYFVPMCGVILLGFAALDCIQKKGIWRVVLSLTSYLLGALVTVWLLGGFISGMDDGAPGLGYYSFNLAGFFSPQDWSSLFDNLPNYADGQYEGFAYLGFGLLVLCLVALTAVICRVIRERLYTGESFKRLSREHRKLYVSAVMGLLSVAMAASHEVSFGSTLLFRIPIPHAIEELWAVFRASGRLIWPAVYMLMFAIICAACRECGKLTETIRRNGQKRTGTMAAVGLLLLCLLFQLYDLHGQLFTKHQEFAPRREYESELQSTFWQQILQERDIRHIVFADKNNMNQEQLYSFADYASEHDLTINDFYFARALTYPIEAVADDFMKHANQNTLYIFTEKARERCGAYDFYYYVEDGFIIGVTDAFSF